MRIAEIVTDALPNRFWRWLTQLGVGDVVVALPRGAADWRRSIVDHPWSYAPMASFQQTLGSEGLQIAVVEDNPPMEEIRYGRPGREAELANVVSMIRTMGRLGIPVWCYNWATSVGWVRTDVALRGRGGALVTGFDYGVLDHSEPTVHGPIAADALWANLSWFLERVLPVAEEAGVTLAMHPDDPPVPRIRGIDRIMSSVAGFDRLLELSDSPANAVTFCQGNFTLMTDDLPALIRRYGGAGRIAFAHFRDVRGTAEKFVETFHDEGQTDMLACMQAYADVGFDGVMRSDHVPLLDGDTEQVPGYSDLARLHAIGYMTGLSEAVRRHHVAGR